MTAKEWLHERVEALREEPWSEEDEAAAAKGRADVAAGRTALLDEALR